MVAAKWFKVIKEAHTVNDCLSLLTLMAAYYPSHTDYVKRMADTMPLWADVYKAWEFTLGYKYTAVAEHWSRSLVHVLGKESVPMSGLVKLVRRLVKKHEVVTYEAPDVKLNKECMVNLIKELADRGLKTICDAIIAYVMPADKADLNYEKHCATGLKTVYRILCTVSASLKFRCSPCVDELDLQSFNSAKYDNPDASSVQFCKILSTRMKLHTDVADQPIFLNHIDPDVDEVSGKLVLVSSKLSSAERRSHLVFLYDGALLCDCSEFHQYGFWCRHAFALVVNGIVRTHVSPAIDVSYAHPRFRNGSAPSVIPDALLRAFDSGSTYKVTQPWHWGKDMLEQNNPEL